MSLFKKIVLAAGVAPLLIAAQAPTNEPPAGTKAEGQAKGLDIVCKKFPPPVGTRLGKKRQICKSQAEWDYIHAQDQEALEHAMRKPHDGR